MLKCYPCVILLHRVTLLAILGSLMRREDKSTYVFREEGRGFGTEFGDS